MRPVARPFLALCAFAAGACGGGLERRTETPKVVSANYTLIRSGAHPPFAIAARDGSSQVGISIAIATDADDAAPLAGLAKVRFGGRFGSSVAVSVGDGSYRIRIGTAQADVLTEVQNLLLAKVNDAEAKEANKEALKSYASAPPVSVVTRCEGRLAVGTKPFTGKLDAAALEAVRARNHVSARVAFGVVAPGSLVETTTASWRSSRSSWPEGSPIAEAPIVPAASPTTGATITRTPGHEVAMQLVLWTPDRARAIAAAEALVADKTALRTRIEAERLRLTMVQATVLPTGGACVVLRAEAEPESATRITAAALGTAPLRFVDELDSLARYTPAARAPRLRGASVVDAAEELSWWVLSRDGQKGVASGKHVELVAPEARDTEGAPTLVAAVDVAPELVSKIEGGHTAFHVLVGSPCGTLAEGSYNAGLGAWAAQAAALDARGNGFSAAVPVVRADAVGLYVQDTPMPGESAEELAFRVTSLALRSWFLPDPRATSRARRDLASRLTAPSGDLLSRAAQMRSPAHPSWVSPFGTADSVLRQPDGILAQADAGPRSGPLRVAIIASEVNQKDAALRAAALWKPPGANKCEVPPQESVRPLPPPSATTDAVLLGLPTKGDRRVADVWAKLLGEPTGPLGKALQDVSVRQFTVTAEGRDEAKLLVVRLEGAGPNLARAEEAVRKTIDALRDAALPEADLARGIREVESSVVARLEWLFVTGPQAAATPVTPTMLRAFASQFFKSDASIRTP